MNKEDSIKEKFKQALQSTYRVISEDYKIKGKSCVVKGDDWQENISARKNPGHEMNQGLCFQYYNPEILNFIASRLK